MSDLEDAVRSALRSLPEPDMRLPVGFPDELRRKYQRRQRYAPAAVAGLVAAAGFTAVFWHSQTDTSSPIPPAVTQTPITPAPTRSSPPPTVIPDQRLSEVTLPAWGNDAGGDLVAWLGTPRALTVAGSPVFVVGETVPGPAMRNDPTMSRKPNPEVEFERTDAQVDRSIKKGSPPVPLTLPSGVRIPPSPQRNPFYGCGTGTSGTEGTFGLTSPPVMQLRCWPVLQENIWVWPRLPANVTGIAYVLDGHIVARSTTLDGVGAIRIPRPASAAADQGQLEALTATGDVISRVKLPWIS